MTHSPGLLSPMFGLKARKDNDIASYVLMFDRKKIRKGGDVDLLGSEEISSLKNWNETHSLEKKDVTESMVH